MANNVHFSFTADGSNANYTIKQLDKATASLMVSVSNTGKVIQNTYSGIFPKLNQKLEKGSKQITKATQGWWAPFKNFGIWIRSLHIYGLDGLTKGFAKLGSTILGSFISPITLAATAIMGIGIGIKNWWKNTHDTIEQLRGKQQDIIKFSNQRIQKFNEQAKAVKNLIDQLKELSKAEPFGKVQKTLSQTIIAQIQRDFPDIAQIIKRDERGRVTNTIEVQAAHQQAVRDKTIKQAKEQIHAYKQLLGYNLANITNDKSDRDFFTKDMAKVIDFNNKGWRQNLPIFDLFAADSNILESLDLEKFVLGTAKERRDWLIAAKRISTNQDRKKIYQDMIDIFDKIIEEEDKIVKASFPIDQVMKREQQVRDSVHETQKNYAETKRVQKELADQAAKKAEEDHINSLASDKQRAQYYGVQAAKLEKNNKEIQKQIDAIDKELADKGIKFDQEGQLDTSRLNRLLKTQEKLNGLYKNEKIIRQARDKRIQDQLGDDVKELENLKAIVDEIENSKAAGEYNIRDEKADADTMSRYNFLKGSIESRRKKIQEDYNSQLRSMRNTFFRQNNMANVDIWQKESNNLDFANQKLRQRLQLQNKQKANNKEIEDSLKKQTEFEEKQAKTDKQREQSIAKAAQEQKQKNKTIQDFYKRYGDPIKEQMYKEQGMQKQWKRLQYMEQMADLNEQINGDRYLTSAQEQLAQQMAELDYLKSLNQQFNPSNSQYSVRTNSLAERGGFSSSIVIDGLSNINKQQLKTMKQSESLLNSISETQGRVLSLLENVMRY